MADVAVVAKCHLSALYKHTQGKLFAQLVDLLQFYEGFEINDHVGTQLKDDEVLQSHYDRFLAFQLLTFKKVPQVCNLFTRNRLMTRIIVAVCLSTLISSSNFYVKTLLVLQLRELALANVGSVHKRADLSKKLSVLTPEELRDLVCNKVCLQLTNNL